MECQEKVAGPAGIGSGVLSAGGVLLDEADAATGSLDAFFFVQFGQGREHRSGFVRMALAAVGDGQLRTSGVVIRIQRSSYFQERDRFINATLAEVDLCQLDA